MLTGHVTAYLHQLRVVLDHVEAARKAAIRG